MFWIYCGAFLLALSFGFFFLKLFRGLRAARPRVAKAKERGRVRVLCLGDSLLQGGISDDILIRLRRMPELGAYEFLNFGSNGDIAWNLNQRIDAVLKSQPEIVFVLIGTNDARGCEDKEAAAYYMKEKGAPVEPTEAFFREQYEALMEALTSHSGLQVIGCTLPLLGEEPDSKINQLLDRFSAHIQEVCRRHDFPCLAFRDLMFSELSNKPSGFKSPPYTAKDSLSLIVRASFQHLLLGRSFDDIGAANGLYLSSDMVHLNERTGALLAGMLAAVLRERLTKKG